MATFDSKKNLAYSTVGTAPVTATAGTSLIVQAGDGTKFPTPPFNATVWPTAVQATVANSELVRVTAIVVDTLTIVRQTESSGSRSIVAGDQIAATITAKALTDIEAAFTTVGAITAPVGGAIMWFSAVAPTGWLILDGSAVSRATYAELFALWSTYYGAGDAVTTFNLPDMRQRIPIGKAAAGSVSVLGTTTGSLDHTHTSGSLTVASHTHGPGTLSVAAHTHGSGTLQVASHSHGPGTLAVAGHTHDNGSYSTNNVNLAHTHTTPNHSHTYSGTTDSSGSFITVDLGAADNVSRAAHDHTYSGTTDSGGGSNTGSALTTHSHSVDFGVSGSTAPAVSGGTTATSAPTVNSGATASTTPAVDAGVTAATSPLVSSGVTGTANPPVLVVNFIVRATSAV